MSVLLRKKVKEEIDRAQRILLLTDERIDGDTIGSTLGMFHVLNEAGKDVTVYSPQPLPPTLEFLPGTEVIRRDETLFDDAEYDLIMIFDCADGEYIKKLLPRMKGNASLIVFDHHATNPHYGTYNIIEAEAASSADVVWRFVEYANFEITKSASQCILTGICTDTNAFSTANTTAACMDAAHELAKYGAKLREIIRHTMINKSLSTLKLWGIAFERLHHNVQFDALTTVITQKDIDDTGVTETESRAMIEFLNEMIEGVDAIVVLKEGDDGSVKASLRSTKRNVAKLAQRFGGGGHDLASGFKIPDATLEEKDGQWFIRKTGGEILMK